MSRAHLHVSVIHAVCTFLEFLLVWIPVKLIAARYSGASALASATLYVL